MDTGKALDEVPNGISKYQKQESLPLSFTEAFRSTSLPTLPKPEKVVVDDSTIGEKSDPHHQLLDDQTESPRSEQETDFSIQTEEIEVRK